MPASIESDSVISPKAQYELNKLSQQWMGQTWARVTNEEYDKVDYLFLPTIQRVEGRVVKVNLVWCDIFRDGNGYISYIPIKKEDLPEVEIR